MSGWVKLVLSAVVLFNALTVGCGSSESSGVKSGSGAGGLGGVGGAGSGGAGGSGGKACVPGSEQTCYTGPVETQGVGMCKAGVQVCREDGLGFGECKGELVPRGDSCSTKEDEDCDGK